MQSFFSLSLFWRISILAFCLAGLGAVTAPFIQNHAYRSLEQLSAKQGLTLESAQFDFSLTQGFQAKELIFSHQIGNSSRRLLEVNEASFIFELSSFFSSKPQLRKIHFQDAQLNLLAKDIPAQVTQLSGTLSFEQDWVHLLNIEACYHGLQILASGKIPQLKQAQSIQPTGRLERYLGKQGQILAHAEGLLEHINLDKSNSRLVLEIQPAIAQQGGEPDELWIQGNLSCQNLLVQWPQAQERFDSLEAHFQWDGSILELNDLILTRNQKSLQAHARFNSRKLAWQAELESKLDASHALSFIQSLSPSSPNFCLLPNGQLRWQVQAQWQDQLLSDSWLSQINLQGAVRGNQVQWHQEDGSVLFEGDALKFEFAWNGQALRLAQVELTKEAIEWNGQGAWQEGQLSLELQAQVAQSKLITWAQEHLGMNALEQNSALSSELNNKLLAGNAPHTSSLTNIHLSLYGSGKSAKNWYYQTQFNLPSNQAFPASLNSLAPSKLTLQGSLEELLIQ